MSFDLLVAQTRRIAVPLAVVATSIVVYVTSLASGGAPSELTTAPDEAAHYVTALMIRGYLASGLDGDPRAFAEQYYLYYPKVGFGVWPPLFHLLLGVWLLVAGSSLSSALLWMSLTTTIVGVLLFCGTRRSLGWPLATATVVWFITMPGVQLSMSSVMLDMMCALFLLAAALSFARYMDTESTRDALWFSILASAAILTKYNGLALALLPPIAIVAARRWQLLRRGSFWLMPVVVAVFCGPWYVLQRNMVRYAAEPVPTGSAWLVASRDNLAEIVAQVGIAAVPLIVIGFVVRVVRRPAHHTLWASLFALAVALWVFHSVVYPITGSRYFIAPFACAALFAAAGLHWVATHAPWPRLSRPEHRRWCAAGALAALVLVTFSSPPRIERGFADAARVVLPRLPATNVTTLVSSDPVGEGAFVAYVAEHEPSPRSFVLRGSKLFASDTWMGLNYFVRYQDSQSILAALDMARVEFVVLDDASQELHHRLLTEAVSTSDEWGLMRPTRVPESQVAQRVRIYARASPLPPGSPRFELQTGYTIGHTLRSPEPIPQAPSPVP